MAYGTIKVDTIENTNGLTGNAIGPGFKNRIINGDMRIDQRNAGAAVTVNSGTRIYSLDRFFGYGESTDGVFTIQQSSTAPTGFVNSALITTTTADASVGASQYYLFAQSIEGFNIADLGWGAAGAKTVTLSFWVRSSLTGQFGGSLTNSGNNRSYPFSYTISSANTFEYKTITIAGDTTGTWSTTNGRGIDCWWDLGSGSSNLGTAGAWAGAAYYGATGDTKLISTLNATWYITGVQLEVGPSATSFDYRPYGTELALCQRYYWEMVRGSTADNGTNAWMSTGYYYSTVQYNLPVMFPVRMRTSPSLRVSNSSNYFGIDAPGAANLSTFTIFWPSPTGTLIYQATTGGTAGYAAGAFTNNASAFCAFSAEL